MTFDAQLDELDHLITRITRANAQLVLEPEGNNWLVIDRANDGEVMMRSPDTTFVVRFVRAFLVRHPEATVDWGWVDPGAHSVKVPTLRVVS